MILSQKLTLTHNTALFNEADQHGHRDVLEAMWVEDTSHAQFLQDQLTNSMSSELVEACGTLLTPILFCIETGSKLNRWSLRIGMFMHVLGACVHVCAIVILIIVMF